MNPFVPPMALGVSANKKADLDALTRQITIATAEVVDRQNIVTALTAKSAQFAGYLAAADANRTVALSNFNLVRDASRSSVQLKQSALLACKQSARAVDKINIVSAQMSDLIYKLIFSGEIIDKLNQLVNKQKSINPTIPDDLIKFLSQATADANVAMSATLTAMTSCYAAEATGMQSKEALVLAVAQIEALYLNMMPAENPAGASQPSAAATAQAGERDLVALFARCYQQSLTDYQQALSANSAVTQQLAQAQIALASANSILNSVKSGLAAATAAAFAA